ncbi:MAG TPA: HAMP domain-containing sensor histidine kinase, partial [Polyangiales bacterium]
RDALGAAARCAIPTFASAFALYLFEGDALKLTSSHHRDAAQKRRLGKFAAYAGRRLSELHAQIMAGPARKFSCNGDQQLRRLGATFGVGLLFVAPLVGRRGALGVVCFGCDDPARGDGDAQRPLEELARRCATALDQAILLDELRETVEARDMLLALVSHDLRNPLNAISLTAGSMSAPPEGGERRKSSAELKLIQRSAAHMHVMLEDLLTAASIDSGKFVVDAVAVDAALLVREALAMTGPLLEARRLTLEQHCDDKLPSVRADALRVQQVFSNLIGNAAKFTPYGGTLRITATRDGPAVRFGVSDSGPGIAPDLIPLIFRRYWTAGGNHRSTSLGLGLFIAQRIVDAHGGRIWVESVEGQGAAFYFTLMTLETASRSAQN